eukprot:Rhum_TRINITY_DN2638_c0_g1::Rhum_TRINITY_DN2638_c0_g1_i1::g.7676::m.7676
MMVGESIVCGSKPSPRQRRGFSPPSPEHSPNAGGAPAAAVEPRFLSTTQPPSPDSCLTHQPPPPPPQASLPLQGVMPFSTLPVGRSPTLPDPAQHPPHAFLPLGALPEQVGGSASSFVPQSWPILRALGDGVFTVDLHSWCVVGGVCLTPAAAAVAAPTTPAAGEVVDVVVECEGRVVCVAPCLCTSAAHTLTFDTPQCCREVVLRVEGRRGGEPPGGLPLAPALPFDAAPLLSEGAVCFAHAAAAAQQALRRRAEEAACAERQRDGLVALNADLVCRLEKAELRCAAAEEEAAAAAAGVSVKPLSTAAAPSVAPAVKEAARGGESPRGGVAAAASAAAAVPSAAVRQRGTVPGLRTPARLPRASSGRDSGCAAPRAAAGRAVPPAKRSSGAFTML